MRPTLPRPMSPDEIREEDGSRQKAILGGMFLRLRFDARNHDFTVPQPNLSQMSLEEYYAVCAYGARTRSLRLACLALFRRPTARSRVTSLELARAGCHHDIAHQQREEQEEKAYPRYV